MESANILNADILDIIFDNRNKEYGAYDLRKHYRQRLTKAFVIILLLVILICLTYVLFGSMKDNKNKMLVTPDITLDGIKPPDAKIITPSPPKLTTPPEIKMRQLCPPLIVADPPENERLSEQDDLTDAKIGTTNAEGKPDDEIDRPVEESKGIVDSPKKIEDDGEIIGRVEIESEYPGGIRQWGKFLMNNLQYPQASIDNRVEGTVEIQFIVDKEGNVSDIKAISGPEELRPAAIAAIKKSGKWTAAIQNGRKVKSYKTQPITFKLEKEE